MFDQLFFALSQEGYLVRSSLCIGLTEIRNANIGDKGRFYTGFFQLAIGIERLAKLALILQHLVDHDLNPPGREYVRKYSHDLYTLFHRLNKLAVEAQSETVSAFALGPIPTRSCSFFQTSHRELGTPT
jgi:hypothetical protein